MTHDCPTCAVDGARPDPLVVDADAEHAVQDLLLLGPEVDGAALLQVQPATLLARQGRQRALPRAAAGRGRRRVRVPEQKAGTVGIVLETGQGTVCFVYTSAVVVP